MSPTSHALRRTSSGQVPSLSYSQATGRISLTAKSCAISRSAFCSSVSVKSTTLGSLQFQIDWSVNDGRSIPPHVRERPFASADEPERPSSRPATIAVTSASAYCPGNSAGRARGHGPASERVATWDHGGRCRTPSASSSSRSWGSRSCWRSSRCSSAAGSTTRSAAAGSATIARSGRPAPSGGGYVDIAERDAEIRQMLGARNARARRARRGRGRRRGRAAAPDRAGRRPRPARGGARAGGRAQPPPRGAGRGAAGRRGARSSASCASSAPDAPSRHRSSESRRPLAARRWARMTFPRSRILLALLLATLTGALVAPAASQAARGAAPVRRRAKKHKLAPRKGGHVRKAWPARSRPRGRPAKRLARFLAKQVGPAHRDQAPQGRGPRLRRSSRTSCPRPSPARCGSCAPSTSRPTTRLPRAWRTCRGPTTPRSPRSR